MQLLACIFLALWPNSAVTTAIHSSQGRNNVSSQWNQRSRAHHRSASSNENSSSRQLSAKDHLDIIRLGFIPATSTRDDDTSKPSNNVRGGSMDSNMNTSSKSKYEGTCRKQLSAKDQLNIIRLGFIPTTSARDATKSKPSNNDMTHYFTSRGGSMDSSKSKSQRAITIHPLAFASIMAFLAGYSDVLCIRKFQCYATMMTGNVVTLSIALGERKWKDALWRLSLIGSYVVGAASVKSIELACQNSSAKENLSPQKVKSRRHLKIVAPIVATVFAIADRAIGKSTILSKGDPLWNLSLLALGYGMVYASANQALNATITQLLTGHIMKLGSAVSDRFLGPARQWNAGVVTSVFILGSFVVGGTCGAQTLPLVSNEFPLFTVLGIVYALVLALF